MAAATLASLHAADDPVRCLRELDKVELDPSWAGRSALVRVRAALAAGRHRRRRPPRQDAAARSALFALPLTAARAETAPLRCCSPGERPRPPPPWPSRRRSGRGRARLDAAEARLVQGRALAAAGEHDAAKAVLQRVAADAARGGAIRLRNAASRELRALGTRVSANGRRSERAELSERERRSPASSPAGAPTSRSRPRST